MQHEYYTTCFWILQGVFKKIFLFLYILFVGALDFSRFCGAAQGERKIYGRRGGKILDF